MWSVPSDSGLLHIKTDCYSRKYSYNYSHNSWDDIVLTEGTNQLRFLGSF